ncbi:phage head-tail connector protein [Clostridium botulinum]|uniref:head-tail connector protein n=1 Tax=Clostridium botulinum TaxID=1491 RepID=UPI0007743D24|nr:head-tail connector protein [Clostridium botulinum]NFL87476.1 phage head-tail connector protein [Clostridium botulinum]NFO22488.1 phage head-tail connector protein [Clostridium botulinum]
MLNDIKELLGIKNESEDSKLNLYIKMAITLIKKYLNNENFDDSYIEENFSMAIILIVSNAYEYKKSGNKGNIKSISQGARNITYGDNTAFCITDDIKALLPAPYIKTFY